MLLYFRGSPSEVTMRRNDPDSDDHQRKPSPVPREALSSTDSALEGSLRALQPEMTRDIPSLSEAGLSSLPGGGGAAGLGLPLGYRGTVASMLPSAGLRMPNPRSNLIHAELMRQSRQELESIVAASAAAGASSIGPQQLLPSLPSERAALLHQQQRLAAMQGLDLRLLHPNPPPILPQIQHNEQQLTLPRISAQSVSAAEDASSLGIASLAAPVSVTNEEMFRRGNGIESVLNRSEEGDGGKGGRKGDAFEAFPQKLYRMLQEAEEENQEDIISFFPHGRAFVIHNPRTFVSDIMPKYFSTNRMSSFQRQLNLYGFKRITEGNDMGGYHHKFFIKGRPELCENIKRRQGTTQLSKHRRREPNFYAMPPMMQGGDTISALGMAGGALDPRISSIAANTNLLGNSLMMQSEALQLEAARIQQERLNLMALANRRSSETKEDETKRGQEDSSL